MDDGTTTEQPAFEAAFHRLRQVVEELEQGGLPLERSLELYEQGMQLVALCAGQLEQAELRLLEVDSALGQALSALDRPGPDGDQEQSSF